MHDYLRHITVTVPAGTLPTAPQQTAWPLNDGHLASVEIVVPAGHKGITGVALSYYGVQVIPWDAGQWITTDGEKLNVIWDDRINARGFVISTYNTGTVAHKFILRARLRPVIGGHDLGLAGAGFNEQLTAARRHIRHLERV